MDTYTFKTKTRGDVTVRMMGVELNINELLALATSAGLKRDYESTEDDGRKINVFSVKYCGDSRRYIVCVEGKPVSVGVEVFSERFFSLKRIWRFITNKQ